MPLRQKLSKIALVAYSTNLFAWIRISLNMFTFVVLEEMLEHPSFPL